MDNTLVVILEEKLLELIEEYKQLAGEVSLAEACAHNTELKVRAFAKLIERESDGEYSEEKILSECGLEKESG